jgi:23S rRNA pseudouridine2605 synthase
MNVRFLFLSFISVRDHALRSSYSISPITKEGRVVARTFTCKSLKHGHPEDPSSSRRRDPREPKVTLYRADKVLASRTTYSRSEAFQLLKNHRVTMFLSECPHKALGGPSVKIPMNAELYLDGQPIPQLPPDILIFHKPISVLSAMIPSTMDDEGSEDEPHPFHRDHLGNYLPSQYQKIGMHPVGRLDYDTTGLMLFSKDGQLTQRLLHPKYEVERQYVASVQVPVEPSNRTHELREQIEIHGVPILFKDRKDHSNKVESLCFGKILDIWQGDDANTTNIRLVVQEGKHRMVRRMLAHCGYPVVALHRERHGMFELNDLPPGQFRPATDEEISWVQSLL